MFGSIRGAEAEKKALEGKKILRCFFRRRTSLGEVKLSSPEARAGAHDLTRALLLMLLALVMASYLRFPDRAAKPMHVDETTQAVKLGELMAGHYKYDPVDHHGPTLLYATLPVKWFSSARTWNDLTESQLRLVPVLFGMGLLLLLLLVGDGFSSSEMAWGALAVAVSPAMVFYSRYYIMEMLMVFFTFGLIGCGWRFYLTRRTFWMVGAGVFAGLMHATKETCVLQFAAITVGLLGVWVADFFSAGSGLGVVNRSRKNPIKMTQLLVLAGSAALTSVMIFSKFFTAPASAIDSVTTYVNMLNRAGGQGHKKPFFYYRDLMWGEPMSGGPITRKPGDSTALAEGADGVKKEAVATDSSNPFNTLFWKYLPEKLGIKPSARIIWGERLFLVLGLIGMVAAFTTKPSRNQSRHLVRFLTVYTVSLFFIYSMVSYKTPWLVIGPWHGMLILAGVGAASLLAILRNRAIMSVVACLLLLGFFQAALVAYRATRGAPSFVAHVRNPLNYSMTSPDCLDWVRKIHRFGEVSGKGNQLAIVQADAEGGWPLPWYLARKFPNYIWQGGDLELMEKADVVISGLDFRALLPQSIRGADGAPDGAPGWKEFSLTLHPSKRMAIFVRQPIWESYLKVAWPELAIQN